MESAANQGKSGMMSTESRCMRFSRWHLLVLSGLLLAVTWRGLVAIEHVWATDPDYSHGFLIALLAVWLTFKRRNQSSSFNTSSRGGGLALIMLGCAAIVLGRWYEVALQPGYRGYVFLLGVGCLCALAGVGWVLLGSRRMPTLAPSLALLLFTIPIPDFIMEAITLPLRGIAASAAAGLIRHAGVPVLREGNILHLAQGSLGVDDACSGIRSAWALLAAAAALIAFLRLRASRGFMLLALAPLLAVGANVMRILASAIAVTTGHAQIAQGLEHAGVGLAATALAAGVLVTVARALSEPARSAMPPPESKRNAASPGVPAPVGPVSWAAAILLSAILCLVVIGYHYGGMSPLDRRESVPRKPLADFPATLGSFQRIVAMDPLSPEAEATLACDDRLGAIYSGPGGSRVALSILYWNPRSIRLAERHYWSAKAPHKVDVCYPLAGWRTESEIDMDRQYPWLPAEKVNIHLLSQGAMRQVVVSWSSVDQGRPTGTLAFFTAGPVQRLRALVKSWRHPPEIRMQPQYKVMIAVEVTDHDTSALENATLFARSAAPLLPNFGLRQTADVNP